MTPRQRDIVLIPVPFTHLSTSKKRPVLVLSKNAYNRSSADVLVAAITSNLQQKGYGVSISSEDLQEGALPRNSRIRIDKIYTLSKENIVKRYARLGVSSFEAVLRKLDDLLGR